MRLDVYMVENNLTESRKKAQDLIKEGSVFVDGINVIKPSFTVDGSCDVKIEGEVCPYVGRGGYKLAAALKYFNISVENAVCIDIGSSTGGFTDCLLRNGASKVYAVDSGKGQLHNTLRSNDKVIVMEETNAKYLTFNDIGEFCDIAVMDVSFISQTLLYDTVACVLKNGGSFISLIKPQFEAGRSNIGKNGIVKDEKIRLDVCQKVKETAAAFGLINKGIVRSPIQGGDGNIEFLALFEFAGVQK